MLADKERPALPKQGFLLHETTFYNKKINVISVIV